MFRRQGLLGWLGDLLLLWEGLRFLWEWRYTRWLLEMANVGQAIDFVLDHWEHPGWIGVVFGNPLVQFAIIIIGLLLIFWDRKRPRWLSSPDVSPRQMIFGGLIIIIIGAIVVGIGLWQQPATPITIGVSAIAGAPIGGALPPNTQVPSTPNNKKKYTAYEIDQRLRAIDEIYAVITEKLTPVFISARDLINNIKAEAAQGTAEKNLREQYKKTEAAFGELKLLFQKYEYFPDIIEAATKNTYNGLTLMTGCDNVINEIQHLNKIAANNASEYIDRDIVVQEFRNSVQEFDKYLQDTKPRLKQIRAKYTSAEVYKNEDTGTPNTPVPQKKSENASDDGMKVGVGLTATATVTPAPKYNRAQIDRILEAIDAFYPIILDIETIMREGPEHVASIAGIVRDRSAAGFIEQIDGLRLRFNPAYDLLEKTKQKYHLYQEACQIIANSEKLKDEYFVAFNELVRALRQMPNNLNTETFLIFLGGRQDTFATRSREFYEWATRAKESLVTNRQFYLQRPTDHA